MNPRVTEPQHQYGKPGDRCTRCSGTLSRYNPYTFCGPCRATLLVTQQCPTDAFGDVKWPQRRSIRVLICDLDLARD